MTVIVKVIFMLVKNVLHCTIASIYGRFQSRWISCSMLIYCSQPNLTTIFVSFYICCFFLSHQQLHLIDLKQIDIEFKKLESSVDLLI